MATIAIAHSAGDEVFHVDAITGVRRAVVKNVSVTETTTVTTIRYSLQYVVTQFGVATVEESALYADIDAALAAYKLMI